MSLLAALGLSLLIVGLILLWWTRRERSDLGLPEGRVAYVDTSRWLGVKEPLFSYQHRLAGRPDYLVESEGNLIPVEVKPLCDAQNPRPWDVMQLAAYCLLVEEERGEPPPYGLLCYGERAFRIAYSQALRCQLLETMAKMREGLKDGEGMARQHREPGRCRRCGYSQICGQSLGWESCQIKGKRI